jgi:hypothetical protein
LIASSANPEAEGVYVYKLNQNGNPTLDQVLSFCCGVVVQAVDCSHANRDSSLLRLPVELLARVLRKLIPRHLAACSITCRALRTAAVAATEQLQLSNITQQRADSIALWLAKHSSDRLQRLDLSARWDVRVRLALPFQELGRLKQLTLRSFALLQRPGACSSCSDPEVLKAGGLGSCCSPFAELAQLSCLQQLRLDYVSHAPQAPVSSSPSQQSAQDAARDRAALEAALGAALAQLSQLTELQLDLSSNLALAAVSGLTQLQKFDLNWLGPRQNTVQLQLLPSGLVELQLRGVSRHDDNGDGGQLSVFNPPAAVLRMPQLQQLRLDGRWLDVNMERLLNALSQLERMVYMVLREFSGVAPAANYAALTASPHLKGFELTNCRMAAAAAQHMFPAGRVRPQLQRMRIAGTAQDRWANHQADGYLGLVLGPGDAAQLVSCCPQLQELGPVMVRQYTAPQHLQPLVQLSALTRLQIGGAACDDALAEHMLAHLTGEQSTLGAGDRAHA